MSDIVGGGMSDGRDLSDIDSKRPQITRSVDGSLRDRIAAVIDKHTYGFPHQSYELADAVIRELGLKVERGGTYEVGEEATSHRYVTEWVPDA